MSYLQDVSERLVQAARSYREFLGSLKGNLEGADVSQLQALLLRQRTLLARLVSLYRFCAEGRVGSISREEEQALREAFLLCEGLIPTSREAGSFLAEYSASLKREIGELRVFLPPPSSLSPSSSLVSFHI